MPIETRKNEVFALRDELIIVRENFNQVTLRAFWFVVKYVLCEMPLGPRDEGSEGDMSQQFIVAAAYKNHAGLWQWLHLSSAIKDFISGLLKDLESNRWWYFEIEKLNAK